MSRPATMWSTVDDVARFVVAWETGRTDRHVADMCGDHGRAFHRAAFLRDLGVPVTRYVQKKPALGETSRAIDWPSPFSVNELVRLARLAFLSARFRWVDPVAKIVGDTFPEPFPDAQHEEVEASGALLDAVIAERRAVRAVWRENKLNARRERRRQAVARGERARDVN